MIGLLRHCPLLALSTTRSPNSRAALLGAVLALFAVFGLITLSGWHSADFHDHDLPNTVFVEHGPGASGQNSPENPIHLGAHAVGQVLPASQTIELTSAPVEIRSWSASEADIPTGVDPARLLRPPRA